MELREILAISGQPGLYKYVAQSTRGVIVESLIDGRRMNASATAKVSALSEISMFTEGDDIALVDVFTRIYAHTGGKEAIDPKETPEHLKAYFAEVLPEYDRDRVHVSDMKKCFSWYNILVRAGFTEFKTAPDEASDEAPAEADPPCPVRCRQAIPSRPLRGPGFFLPSETAPESVFRRIVLFLRNRNKTSCRLWIGRRKCWLW